MTNPIYTCLWYNGTTKQAAAYYLSVFNNAKLVTENDFVSILHIENTKLMCLNGGPQYKHTPAVSQFVTCENDTEIKHLWEKLSDGGTVLMTLDKYPWSELYGWCQDKFGVSWQIYKGKMSDVKQKIVPCFLFVNQQYGKAEEAMHYHISIIKNASIDGITKYDNGTVMHAQFRLKNSVFMTMDGEGEHKYNFTPATSFVIECETQDEIDYYWEKLGHQGEYNMCGWLTDKYGIAWQVIPKVLSQLMNDPERAPRVVKAFFKMNKFDIQQLLDA